nr:unnamed protein product [Spirometra erinaceieuropaei]
MTRPPLWTHTQTILIVLIIYSAHVCGSPTYDLCKGQHTDCNAVSYRAEDPTKGSNCRTACAKKRGELDDKITAYFCEDEKKPCVAYDVYGRKGYADNFKRHVMCVKLCHFVGAAQHSSVNKCAFVCDGWTKLENTVEATAIFCTEAGVCEEGRYFSPPKEGSPFEDLKTCFKKCMSDSTVYSHNEKDQLEEAQNMIGQQTIVPSSVKIAQVLQLLKFCLRTYFTFDGTIYEQVKGTPMGSPISGFIAEAVLQRLESLVFQHHKPKFWARYVDDTFVVMERDQLLTFKESLNAVFPDI